MIIFVPAIARVVARTARRRNVEKNAMWRRAAQRKEPKRRREEPAPRLEAAMRSFRSSRRTDELGQRDVSASRKLYL